MNCAHCQELTIRLNALVKRWLEKEQQHKREASEADCVEDRSHYNNLATLKEMDRRELEAAIL